MNIDPQNRTPVENFKKTPLFEVVNIEKLWWALMNSKGILNTEVQDLYRKARILYEKIILNDYKVVELQEVEYCLWKLHYKCIDEFRKRVKSASSNASNLQNGIDIHTEGFRYFLFEATEFYKDLITNTRILYEKDDVNDSVKPLKIHDFQYIHHRFLVCLGDLARYRELSKKNDLENRNWSAAANYYFEATKVCPDSGNPQNQLALLATYVGDDFLALYHCVRSLAVKEPFPDAWDNLMLLFENNRSSHLPSLSVEERFDFSNPSQRVISSTNSHERKADLWPLFVRMISFFLVKSSIEDFKFTFASTMRELESLLSLDDIKLRDSLESYERMDSVKKGPYRTLQIVAALTFILRKLDENQELNDPKEKYNLALTATFVCMGRIIERCNSPDPCLLLSAVLVFIEWLVNVLDKVESCSVDEKVSCSISYFFGAFSDLLNRLDTKDSEIACNNALWEDDELRGFVPISQENISFVSRENSENGSRICRLFLAGMKIAEKSQKWISYDESRKKFYAAKDHDNQNEESQSQSQSQSHGNGDTVSMEEEEVILFRPITRFNSVPIDYDKMFGQDLLLINESPAFDESLKRASSLFDPKNRVQPGSSKLVKLPEPATFPPSGPPSLSAWVIKKENLTKDFIKQDLNPIEEIDSLIGSTHIAEPTQEPLPYIAPVPSAPFLPEDAVWFERNSPYFPEKLDGILGPSPMNLGPLDHSAPYSGMSSSEWLYNYQNRNNQEGHGNHVWPVRDNYNSHYAFDRWRIPTISDPTVYTEGPQLYVGPGQGNGFGYRKPSLLQYLKGREWQLRGLHNMGN